MTGTETTGLLAWINDYGNYVAFFAQLAFWAVLGFAALWAATTFKRLVDYQVGLFGPVVEQGVSEQTDADFDDDEPVAIEEFVE